MKQPASQQRPVEIERYQGELDRDLGVVARNRLAERITGGLSRPSKMPEAAWGIPASRCNVGSTLMQVKGSVCSACYAAKGRYKFHRVQKKLEERYEGLAHPQWVPSMVLLIRWNVGRYFRWFDAGDLASENHLYNICEVARHTPDIRHWLPTREYEVVKALDVPCPENLTIRVSANMIDCQPPAWPPQTSMVITKEPPGGTHLCPAPEQGNVCGSCRACWDKDVANVAYFLH